MLKALESIQDIVDSAFPGLRVPARKNLAVVCHAFLSLMASARSGAGRMSLASLFRLLPTDGPAHSRENRLRRFLDNPRVDGKSVSCGLIQLVCSRLPKGFYPVLFDQSKSGNTQTLFAAIPFEGRALPLSIYSFEYPWNADNCVSQNALEKLFLMDIAESVPEGFIAVFVGDRGYCKAILFRFFLRERIWFLIRATGNPVIEVDGKRMKLKELSAPPGQAVRYEGVLYHAEEKIEMDIVVYHDPRHQETWRLSTPTWTRKYWKASEVVDVYRSRMRIETGFRDFKTHLGLRGLKLKARIAERMGRLLMAFCLAYVLLVLLGTTKAGQSARADLETPRATARHGSTRTISAMFLAMMMLSHPKHAAKALQALLKMLALLSAGKFKPAIPNIYSLPHAMPP